jgi:hypothetical protein
MKHYLSIDCANKSLAIGLYSIDSEFTTQLINIIQANSDIADNYNTLNELIIVRFLKVFDLTPNKKITDTDILEKSIALKQVLHEIIELTNDTIGSEYELLVEYQMNVNDKSRCVYNQIIYEFIDKCVIHRMIPSKKNLIHLKPELSYGNIMNNSNSNYRCNKNHSKYNFLHFIDSFKYTNLIKPLKKSNYDDIADTFMQLIAFLLKV